MIPSLVVTILICAVLWFVLAPLRKSRPHGKESESSDDLAAERERALGALIELEEDRMVGKLSDDDFEALRSRYEAEALETLRRLSDATEIRAAAFDDEELESEIAAVRAQMECPQCGSLRSPEGACAECGAR